MNFEFRMDENETHEDVRYFVTLRASESSTRPDGPSRRFSHPRLEFMRRPFEMICNQAAEFAASASPVPDRAA